MKCIELKANQYTVLMECAGHQMQKDDVVIVDEKIADRIALQYKMTKGESHEIGKLQNGSWQVKRMTIETKDEVGTRAEEFETVEGVATDKSMGTTSGSVKKKATKKKKTTKKV